MIDSGPSLLLLSLVCLLLIVTTLGVWALWATNVRYNHRLHQIDTSQAGRAPHVDRSVTVVTALYDIGREHVDGRRFGQYLGWLENTLRLRHPMVIFVDPKHASFVHTIRQHYGYEKWTQVISQPLPNIPCYPQVDRMQQVLLHQRSCVRCPNNLEMKSALYNAVIYSKFAWMRQVAQHNPFQSSVLAWFDAGASRFFSDTPRFKYQFHPSWIDQIIAANTIWLQEGLEGPAHNRKPCNRVRFGDTYALIAATLFLGTPDAHCRLYERVNYVLEHEMLACGQLDNEQMALSSLVQRFPLEFRVLKPRYPSSDHHALSVLYQFFHSGEGPWLDLHDRLGQPMPSVKPVKSDPNVGMQT